MLILEVDFIPFSIEEETESQRGARDKVTAGGARIWIQECLSHAKT